MEERKCYRKKDECFVVAVKLDLDTKGFNYFKWGAKQTCKPGDWLIDNDGDIYTIDQEVFSRTYRKVSSGMYVKTTLVWAGVATDSGRILTKEGSSQFEKGDFLVYNNKDGTDGYCMSASKFKSMYELVENGD